VRNLLVIIVNCLLCELSVTVVAKS
jgi:hypothetical protein